MSAGTERGWRQEGAACRQAEVLPTGFRIGMPAAGRQCWHRGDQSFAGRGLLWRRLSGCLGG